MSKGLQKTNAEESENELMQTTGSQLVVPASFLENGFTEDEALSGMPPADQSYLKSFPYFIRSKNGSFEIRDNAKDEPVWSGNEIKGAIVYFGHEISRLKLGHVKGLQTDEKTWSDEDKEVVAISYDRQSQGNFPFGGHESFLGRQHKDIHPKMKRLYIFIVAPSLKLENKFGVIAGSFGISTAKGFSGVRKELDQLTIPVTENGKTVMKKANLPLPFVKVDIKFVPETNANGDDFQRITFEFSKNEKTGGLDFAFKSPQHYRESGMGLALLEKIIESHKAAVELAEKNQLMMSSGQSEKTVQGLESMGTDVTSEINADSDDDIPF